MVNILRNIPEGFIFTISFDVLRLCQIVDRKECEKIYLHNLLILYQDSTDHFLSRSSEILVGLDRIPMASPLVPVLDENFVFVQKMYFELIF